MIRRLIEQEYITIKINLKVIGICLLGYGLYTLKHYYYIQGAQAALAYVDEQMSKAETAKPEGEPGKLDHRNDNPNM